MSGPPPSTRSRLRSPHLPVEAAPAAPSDASSRVPRVSIVVPTFNEAGNIDRLLDRIAAVMGSDGVTGPWEVVVVDDDSADGTWRRVEDRSRRDDRVRLLRRVGHRGLSSAVLAGMAVARGEVLVVIDGDLQHDEERIPDLVAAIDDGADIAMGSRSVDGGGYGTMGRRRQLWSRVGTALARLATGVEVSDPMSGFFAVSRDRYQELAGRLNPHGFKILLEFLARGSRPRVREVGYVFRSRGEGTTKFSLRVVAGFLLSIAELALVERFGRLSRGGR
jgi:dolichol-phosphate mannosyltransferase